MSHISVDNVEQWILAFSLSLFIKLCHAYDRKYYFVLAIAQDAPGIYFVLIFFFGTVNHRTPFIEKYIIEK